MSGIFVLKKTQEINQIESKITQIMDRSAKYLELNKGFKMNVLIA